MNPNARKNIIYSLVLFALVLLVYAWRTREGKTPQNTEKKSDSGKVVFSGKTLGTDYQITYLDQNNRNFKPSVDSLLNVFNLSISNDEPSSEINGLNFRDSLLSPSETLLDVLKEANRMYDLTGGALDPTQQPIEKIWSFSSSGARLQDSINVRIILPLVGLKKVVVTDTLIRKSTSGVFLDFSKSAKGFALDLVGGLLEEKGIKNYLIQIGSEILAKGTNEKEELWKIGLYYLSDSLGSKAEGSVAVQDKAVSSVGNFEQFYTLDSVRLSYTLDPRTGFPVNHGLLGGTLIGSDAKTTDALADALMVLGWREAVRLDSTRSDLQMILIYNEKGSGMKQYISPDLKPFLSFPVK